MTSKKASASSRLKKLARNVPHYEAAHKILQRAQLEKGHAADRAAAIMGGAMVEDALRVVIKRRFDPAFPDALLGDLFDFERKGPLSTLGYRILAGYALGVFGQITYRDLKRINVIRNVFAHSAEEIHFEMPDVKDLCEELELMRSLQPRVVVPHDAKDAYLRTVSFVVGNFRIAIRGANKIRWTPATLP